MTCFEEFVLLSNSVGLNKDFKRMLSEHAEFKALSLKEIRTAADGTKKVDLSFLCDCSLILCAFFSAGIVSTVLFL